MKKILGIGELVWDVFPEGKQLGGAPVNFAFFAKELGAEAYPVAALGTDGLGDEAIQMLKPSGLSLDFIQRNSFHDQRRNKSFWIKYLKHCDLFYHIYTKMSRRIKFYIFIENDFKLW